MVRRIIDSLDLSFDGSLHAWIIGSFTSGFGFFGSVNRSFNYSMIRLFDLGLIDLPIDLLVPEYQNRHFYYDPTPMLAFYFLF